MQVDVVSEQSRADATAHLRRAGSSRLSERRLSDFPVSVGGRLGAQATLRANLARSRGKCESLWPPVDDGSPQ